MSLFKDIFDLISDGGIVGKPTTTPSPSRIMEKAIKSVVEKATERISSELNDSGVRKTAVYGDIIGVRRSGYKHFGVYLSDNSIIHYGTGSGDFGGDASIHETTLIRFLDGANSYFICNFPDTYGRPKEKDIPAVVSGSSFSTEWSRILRFLLKNRDYKLYSPGETVERARSRLGERNYNLITNNCEHFAIWSKTGISESHQVNDFIDNIPVITIHT